MSLSPPRTSRSSLVFQGSTMVEGVNDCLERWWFNENCNYMEGIYTDL